MSHINELIKATKDLQLDCEYWDVRIENTFETSVIYLDGDLITSVSNPAVGAFLRVRKNGFWLYESTTMLSQLRESLLSLSQQPVPQVVQRKYQPEKEAPFIQVKNAHQKMSGVSLDDKIKAAKKYSDLIHGNKLVSSAKVRYADIYKVKSFVNSVGTQFEYDFNQCGFAFIYTLKRDHQLFDDKMIIYGSNFDQLLSQEDNLKKHILESENFLRAPAIAPGKYKVLLNPEVTGVFTHESFGHKSEADFLLGNEDAQKEWQIGSKIASDNLSIVDCGQFENTSGYCPVDDDGYPAQKNYLIQNGRLAGRLHSYDTATQLNEKPTGNSRAMNFEFEPIVRMTSTYIEPGTESYESILKRSEGAVLVEGVKHGSGMSTFTIAPTRGYIIGPNGQKDPVRLSVISGSVFETLGNIEAVSNEFHIHSGAIGGCGKFDQWPLPVAHGGPYVLVKEMQVS